ncbi:hypothetical protein [Antarctobacter jejuensis]|uniref:hypothetical protein n=1 Tax=Antarctobacter jejuensis TaxID=1439938 RepID=UPI003FD288A0
MPKQPTNKKGDRRTIEPVPKIPNRLIEKASGGNSWVGCANDSVKRFNDFSKDFPKRYGWRFKTKEAFDNEIQEAISLDDSPWAVNKIYWTDSLKNLEAYTVMSVWRTAELLRSAVKSLGGGETIASAIVARAAVESVVQFLDVSRKVSPTLEDLQKLDFSNHIIASTELEELILKSVFSSRLPDAEKELNPTNILTILKRVSKIKGHSDLMAHYGVLCEVTHPNFLGRSVYVSEVEAKSRIGDELRVLSPSHGPVSEVLIELALWAISWSAATQVSSALLMQSSIGSFAAKLERTVN